MEAPAAWDVYVRTWCGFVYVILDIYSRYVVGWTLAPSESGELAKDLITDCLTRHEIARDTLTIHADRGTSMTSKPVSQLLVDLGVIRSHSRPHVSNDCDDRVVAATAV